MIWTVHSPKKGRLKMRLVSILGDSVSTFEGYNPPGYAVFYDKEMQEQNGLKTVYDTWWAMVNQALHAYLCVNNAYSGSRVSGKTFPAGESDERLCNLRTKEYIPDYILIYLGFNDFGNGVRTARSKRFTFGKKEPESFYDAYSNMLKSVKAYYPEAKIVCGTLMRTGIKVRSDWVFPEYFAGTGLESYNEVIRTLAKRYKCYLADLSMKGNRYETLDGSHPTAKGHITIARAWIECLSDLGLS